MKNLFEEIQKLIQEVQGKRIDNFVILVNYQEEDNQYAQFPFVQREFLSIESEGSHDFVITQIGRIQAAFIKAMDDES